MRWIRLTGASGLPWGGWNVVFLLAPLALALALERSSFSRSGPRVAAGPCAGRGLPKTFPPTTSATGGGRYTETKNALNDGAPLGAGYPSRERKRPVQAPRAGAWGSDQSSRCPSGYIGRPVARGRWIRHANLGALVCALLGAFRRQVGERRRRPDRAAPSGLLACGASESRQSPQPDRACRR